MIAVVAATPVDDDNTWMLARYYHGSKLLCIGAIKSELWLVQPQDWAVFETLPPGTIDDVPYHFVPADRGIALYRRRRRQLLDATNAEAAA